MHGMWNILKKITVHNSVLQRTLLHATEQYIKQLFHTITIILDEEPIRPDTCRS
jgi:hypothetical protein